MENNRYVTGKIILATPEALDYYSELCDRQKHKDIDKKYFELFSDKHQAFYAAAIVGHNALQGERYEPRDKRKPKQLIRRTAWTDENMNKFRTSFTYLVKLNYTNKDKTKIENEDNIIEVVAELAEKGIRIIHKKAKEEDGEFDFQEILDELTK